MSEASGNLPTSDPQPGADTGDMPPPPAGMEGQDMPAVSGGGPFGEVVDLLTAGGPIMLVLAALSVVTLAVVLYKVIQFLAAGVWTRRGVRRALELWHAGRADEAAPLLSSQRGPVAQVLLTAVHTRLNPHMRTEEAREEAERIAALHIDRLTGGLRLLAVIATLSPLLGLLGTVIGMIDAFQALESAGSKVDPSILSGGIWVALLTTAAGLVVAIPAAAAHQWLEGVVERAGRAMEDAATQVFTRQPATAFRKPMPEGDPVFQGAE